MIGRLIDLGIEVVNISLKYILLITFYLMMMDVGMTYYESQVILTTYFLDWILEYWIILLGWMIVKKFSLKLIYTGEKQYSTINELSFLHYNSSSTPYELKIEKEGVRFYHLKSG